MLKCFQVEFFRGIEGLGPFAYVAAFEANDAMVLAKAQRILSGHRDTEVECVREVLSKELLARIGSLGFLPHILDIEAVTE